MGDWWRIMANIFPEKSKAQYSWRVEWVGAKGRKRKYFSQRKKAEVFLAAVRVEEAHSVMGEGPLSVQERAAVMLARRAGLDLEGLVAAAMRQGERLGGGVDLGELVRLREEEAGLAGLSSKRVAELRTAHREVLERLGADRKVAEVRGDELRALIFRPQWSPGTVGAARKRIRSLFAVAVRRQLIGRNPLDDLAKAPAAVEGEVEILTLEEAQRLWAVCREVAPRLLPGLGLGLWGGLRQAEVERLVWRDVRRRTGMVHVAGRNAKTRQRRLVSVELPLALALECRAGAVGSVWAASGLREQWQRVRAAAGWAVRGSAKEAMPEGRPWPHNALRHSFASYHLAYFKDAARTALEAGHSQAVLFRHYRELVTQEDAEAWWSGWVLE